jgi:hypothetical protein
MVREMLAVKVLEYKVFFQVTLVVEEAVQALLEKMLIILLRQDLEEAV